MNGHKTGQIFLLLYLLRTCIVTMSTIEVINSVDMMSIIEGIAVVGTVNEFC